MSYLKQQAAKLRSQNLGPWGLKARAHWKAHLPSLYQVLEESGDLNTAVLLAQENAGEMLVSQGMSQFAAEELAMKEFLYLPSETEQQESKEN